MNKLYVALTGIIIGLPMMTQTEKKSVTALNKPLLYSTSHQDIVQLFPKTAQEIEERVEQYLAQARKDIQDIITIPAGKRTWANTARALDQVESVSNVAIMCQVLVDLELVSPDKAVRDAAHAGVLKIQEFFIDEVSLNIELYQAVKAYATGNAMMEALSPDQKYFLQETLADYRRHGLDLPQDKRNHIAKLLKDIAALELIFEENISKDNSTISVTLEELAGVDPALIATLKRTNDGRYILGVDYPTYFSIMENCSIESTRKQLYLAFSNRAYPVNEPVLTEVIAKRDELAHLLGFASYAQLDLDEAMAKHPERAQTFLDDLVQKAKVKEQAEFTLLTQELPTGITLTSDGKLKPWDYAYVAQQYKKKHLSVDEQLIAEYFPLESAVAGMLAVYHEFLGVTFKEKPMQGLWSDEVQLIEAYNNDGTLLGYLLLDLFPRANKYTHACHNTTIPAIDLGNGQLLPALSLVIANFTKPTADKPALLHRERDVETFFHEFGHAMHALLGRTKIGSFAGTHTKIDFVELPSQMLEEWLWDAAILKKISKHYKTGQPLSDELITKIQQLKHFDTGYSIVRQILLANISLACYAPGADKNVYELVRALHAKISPVVAYQPEAHGYAAFGHLMGYGAKYYGYLWSKVFALDLFEQIKKHGLLNHEIGKKYVDEILAKGGSQDPNELLKNFLGREPNAQAFMRDMGL